MKNKEKKMKKDEMKKLHESGNYICVRVDANRPTAKVDNPDWYWSYADTGYKLIHIKHKEILDAVLGYSSVEVEVKNQYFNSRWFKEKDFIGNYSESNSYQISISRQGEKVMAKELKEITDEYYKGFGKDNSEYKDGYLAGDMFKNEVLSIKYDNLSKKYMDLVDKYSNLVDKYLELKAN
jgi:hypothetical protein